MLIVFGGLPGTGKSTLSRRLAGHLSAVYLRIDSIEQGLRNSFAAIDDIADAGYRAAYGVAKDNLALGHRVVADSVNPIEITRAAWRAVANDADVAIVEVEVVCSDTVEHRSRVERRTSDIPDLALPDWATVAGRDYEPWQPDIVIDTAGRSVEDGLAELIARLRDLNAGTKRDG